ncbi:MAG: PDZ domain-containing protein, partial [Paracoccus sp. (in: a-proteobacteria)]|nr:PDZ domain-containing protein [Paracoccus sp. (in: a-proteobacteria)]
LSPSGGSIGIGFSMASNVVTQVVDQLKEYGETRRGWLGVRIQDVTPEIAESLGLEAARGALVNDVPEGPAADAGMRAGDVILSFAGREIIDTRDLVRRVADAPYGQPVTLEVLRGGEVVPLEVTLGRRELAEAGGDGRSPSEGPGDTAPSTQDALGMTLQPLTADLAEELGVPPSTQGLVVRAVDPAGVAADRGIGQGDVITEVGQRPVSSLSDFNDRVAEARERGWKSVLMMVRRAGEPRFVALPISE